MREKEFFFYIYNEYMDRGQHQRAYSLAQSGRKRAAEI